MKLSAVSNQLSAFSFFASDEGDVKDFRELKVWQRAHRLALDVYQATKGFPRDEVYSLTSQIRRASVSIPSNIAEGCGRDGDPELARFLQIAMGSASEVEYQLLLSRDLGLLSHTDYDRLNKNVCEVKRMLASFIQTLRATSKRELKKADR